MIEFNQFNLGKGAGIEALPAMLKAVQDIGFAGVNVTYPFKQVVIPLLDELSPDRSLWE